MKIIITIRKFCLSISLAWNTNHFIILFSRMLTHSQLLVSSCEWMPVIRLLINQILEQNDKRKAKYPRTRVQLEISSFVGLPLRSHSYTCLSPALVLAYEIHMVCKNYSWTIRACARRLPIYSFIRRIRRKYLHKTQINGEFRCYLDVAVRRSGVWDPRMCCGIRNSFRIDAQNTHWTVPIIAFIYYSCRNGWLSRDSPFNTYSYHDDGSCTPKLLDGICNGRCSIIFLICRVIQSRFDIFAGIMGIN